MTRMFDWNDPEALEFARTVFQSAEANAALNGLPCDDPKLAAVIQRADFVYAVWREPRNPNGIGILLVRGLEVLDGDDSRNVVCNAIPCADEDAALRLQARYGDSRLGLGRMN